MPGISAPIDNPFTLPLETIVAASSMMGHRLEDRTSIRERQDSELLEQLQLASTVPLHNTSQQSLFVVAPLDILVTGHGDQRRFHIIELNGTGIGGTTNMTADAVSAVLSSLEQIAHWNWDPEAVILVPISGKENEQCPRLNRLMHEKLMFAEALRRGFEYGGGSATVHALQPLLDDDQPYQADQPAVVMGYMKDLLNALELDDDGGVWLKGRRVCGAVNDRFCLNLLQHFGQQVDLHHFQTYNRSFLAGGDKGVCYSALNGYLQHESNPRFPNQIHFEHAHSRDALINRTLAWMKLGRQVVIKPHGTGIGHGIEFFLNPSASAESVIDQVDRSIRTTDEYYHMTGGAFPYTLCEYLDACTINQAEHPLHGHKYELRVVVYRDDFALKAFPSIVKVASEAFDPAHPDNTNLINNITASAVSKQRAGVEYMLPLTNYDTLELLDLSVDDLEQVCKVATGFVGHILDDLQQRPEQYGLPRSVLPFPRISTSRQSIARPALQRKSM